MYLFSKPGSNRNNLPLYVHVMSVATSTVCSWKQDLGQKSNHVHRDTNVGRQHQVDMTRDFRC